MHAMRVGATLAQRPQTKDKNLSTRLLCVRRLQKIKTTTSSHRADSELFASADWWAVFGTC